MRGLDQEASAQTMMDGLRIYYNFMRPHMALNGKTPAQKANIETDRVEWMPLIKKAINTNGLRRLVKTFAF